MDIDDFLDDQAKPRTPQENSEFPREESSLTQEIMADIEDIKKLLTEKNFELVERKYVQAKEQFVELTRLHNNEQNKIYSELEAINKSMVLGLHNLKHETEQKVEVLTNLIAKARLHIKNNELAAAHTVYEEIGRFFSSLSDVLPEKKNQLEHEIATLHVDLINRTHAADNIEFQKKYQVIHQLMVYAFDLVKNHNLSEAINNYHQINKMYEELPKGFLYEKAVLYQQILKLFKLVQHAHHKNLPPEEK